ncbi:MAG: galactose mutarotase [Bacteroidales bacterium]|nr:galactose mutarotase [Bacteroidales bacterium]MCF8455985.1 galactose mutarotase [Bacteroidales bacterium]
MTKIFQLKNKNGLTIEFTNRGGKICAIKIPSQNGLVDIVVGPPNIDDYLRKDEYMGAICGRCANRIASGQFPLNGKQIQLSKNKGKNHLHGGFDGFHKQHWEIEEIEALKSYRLTYLSKDGEEGYPGNLQVSVLYSLNDENEFQVSFMAETDQATIVNLTSHPYFNLKGFGSVLDHNLTVKADHFTPLNKELVATGEIVPVDQTGFDFREPKELGATFQKYNMEGIDQNLVLNNKSGELEKVAVLSHKESNRSVEIFSSQPGLQIYSGLHFDGTIKGKDGKPLKPNMCIAMEPQKHPNTANIPGFGSVTLLPGEVYEHSIVYRFGF